MGRRLDVQRIHHRRPYLHHCQHCRRGNALVKPVRSTFLLMRENSTPMESAFTSKVRVDHKNASLLRCVFSPTFLTVQLDSGVNWFGSEGRSGPPLGLDKHQIGWYMKFLKDNDFNASTLVAYGRSNSQFDVCFAFRALSGDLRSSVAMQSASSSTTKQC